MQLTNGSTVASAQPSAPLQAERCQCCPYGFHIDLDFVNFAQEVTSGRRNPDSVSRRQTPVTFSESKRAKQQLNGGTAQREQTPPSAFKSISKRSLNDIVNDLNELTQYADNEQQLAPDSTFSYSARETPTNGTQNVGFSTLPSKISSKHINWSPHQTPLQNGNGSYYVSSVRQTPTLDSMDSGLWNDIRDTSKTPLTVSANEEVQQILEHQPRSSTIRRSVTSAPTSPIPRTCYTAIGQALSHLKDRTPVSQISRVDHPYTTTTTTPRRSVFNTSSTADSHSAAAKPPIPRKYYFDGNRRNRMLSPDPETSNASPNLLRSSNLQSRSYFKPSNNNNNNVSNNQQYQSKTIPYRSRLNNSSSFGSTGSPLFDSFASVKRSLGLNLNEENRAVSPTNTNSYVQSPSNHTCTPTAQLQNTQTQTPPVQFAIHKNYKDSPTQTIQNQKLLNNNESQTSQVQSKNVSVSTVPNLDRKSVETTTIPTQTTNVSLDTSDLTEPPAKRPQLSFEFQYCIGHESEHLYEELPEIEPKRKQSKSTSAAPSTTNASTLCRPISVNMRTQTDEQQHKQTENSETQTSDDWLMNEVRMLMAAEKAERKSVDKKTETDCEDGEFIMITCTRCQEPIDAGHYEKITDEEPKHNDISKSSSPHTVTIKSSSSSSDQDEGLGLIEPLDFDLIEQQDKSESEHLSPPAFKTLSPQPAKSEDAKSLKSEKSLDDEEREMLSNLDQLANLDPDRFSLASVQTVICVQQPQQLQEEEEEEEERPRQLDPIRTEAIRKLLTEPQTSTFQRESSTNRSYRVEKKALDLDYILDKRSLTDKPPISSSSTLPTDDPEKPLKEMVVLKKFVSIPSNYPDPIPAKIPRPKFTKFSHVVEQAETPDEAAEAEDKLAPLRSELQFLNGWRSGPSYRRAFRHHQYPNYMPAESSFTAQSPPQEDSDEDDIANDPVSTSNSSITSLEEDATSSNDEAPIEFELTAPLKEALETLNKHLLENGDHESISSTDWASKYVQHAWLQIATRKAVSAKSIKQFVDALNAHSPKLLELVVNFVDQNGNTAAHYAVSHENYDIISILLDTKVCKVDETNKAGYSPIMLAALCDIKNETESAIIQRLFERGDVNAKAVYHGQTSLMLSVSHGRLTTTNLLLKLNSDVNMQDIDGSTALMCAAEHGHEELVKILLKQPKIDASLMDCDNQTALSIAVENGHRNIGLLIYAFLNDTRKEQHETNSL